MKKLGALRHTWRIINDETGEIIGEYPTRPAGLRAVEQLQRIFTHPLSLVRSDHDQAPQP